MQVNVLDVGDGGCSVFRCPFDSCFPSASVVDCGGKKGAGDSLWKHLQVTGGTLERMVVTHFDRDHWFGFRRVADLLDDPVSVELIYPRIPRIDESATHLEAGYLALISTAHGTSGVRALDLVRRWERNGHTLSVKRVARGDNFEMACEDWEVLWPPRVVGPTISNAISNRLRELVEFADELADREYPALKNNLEEAYEVLEGRYPSIEDAQDQYDSSFQSESHNDVIDDAPGSCHALEIRRDPNTDQKVFPDWAVKRARDLAKRLGKLNNYFSLVAHKKVPSANDVLVTGDIEGSALNSLISDGRLRARYDLVLAPHHGTHEIPDGFPESDVCIAQLGGKRHADNWQKKHLPSHGRTCFSTRGSMEFR